MDKRKELGQYFTNVELVKLALKLINKEMCGFTIMDPMCGSGNMLVAAQQLGADKNDISGMEIDTDIYEKCREKLPGVNILNKNAFEIWNDSKNLYQRDIILSNPPYIRYQRMGESVFLGNDTVRESLRKMIEGLDELTTEEKTRYRKVIEEYSGLSDLSMPAWLLCMALTKKDGWLVVVLPETWRTRDYASKILAFFLLEFELYYMIEDVHKNWFEGAQVNTNIIIAKKRSKALCIRDVTEAYYEMLHVDCQMKSITIRIKKSVLNLYQIILRNRNTPIIRIGAQDLTYKDIAIRNLEDELHVKIDGSQLTDLGYYGINVGQGLRTGANKFFYVESKGKKGNKEIIATDKTWNLKPFKIDRKYLKAVIRKQSDLGKTVSFHSDDIKGRLLFINQKIAPSEELFQYIYTVENTPITVKQEEKFVPQLSAVVTNISDKSEWYMIPALGRRHLPDMFVPRINDENIIFYHNYPRHVVDANFSTLWTDSYDEKKHYALLAVFNSMCIKIQLELLATVMGAGALKVEANHIRRLLLPLLSNLELEYLFGLGKSLCDKTACVKTVQKEIDLYLFKKIIIASDYEKVHKNAVDFLQKKIEKRKRV